MKLGIESPKLKKVITKLNLATHPFRNRTLPYLIALFLLALAASGSILAFAKLREYSSDNESVKADIVLMQKDLDELNKKGDLVQQQLSPEQRALVVGAHKLIANKSFGWSRLFADLEAVLPGSVSASRISVENIYKEENHVKADLEFAVLSRDYPSVETMINAMNNSGVFKAELRGQDRQKTERSIYTEYTLHLVYTPRFSLPTQENPSNDLVQNQDGK